MRLGLFVLAAGKAAGGPETYEVQLAAALGRVAPSHAYHVYCTSQEASQAFAGCSPGLRRHVLFPRTRWIAVPFSLPLALLRDGIDLFHATYIPPPLAPRPYVFTHHDNSPFDHPGYYDPVVLARLKPMIRRGLARARHIICPSEFTRKRTLELFGMKPDRISVIPHGVGARFAPLDRARHGRQAESKFGLGNPYFLYVGKLQASKNIPRLLEAFARFSGQGSGTAPDLVLAGSRGVRDVDVEEMVGRLGIRHRVRLLGYVDDSELPTLYGAARALVFPSAYEGFGLPVIEAMACGVPVLTSEVGALPEVAGDAAILVNPTSVESIAEGMRRLAADDDLVSDLRVRGLERVRRFSWDEHARRTLEVYQRIVSGSA